MKLKIWLATCLMAWSCRLADEASRLARVVSRLYEVEAFAEDSGLPPDSQIFFLLKLYDGTYYFHGLVARNKEAARRLAWHIPGSLLMLDSLEEFRVKLLSEAYGRTHA